MLNFKPGDRVVHKTQTKIMHKPDPAISNNVVLVDLQDYEGNVIDDPLISDPPDEKWIRFLFEVPKELDKTGYFYIGYKNKALNSVKLVIPLW